MYCNNCITCARNFKYTDTTCIVPRSHAASCQHWVNCQTVCPPDSLNHNGGQHPANYTHRLTCSSHRHTWLSLEWPSKIHSTHSTASCFVWDSLKLKLKMFSYISVRSLPVMSDQWASCTATRTNTFVLKPRDLREQFFRGVCARALRYARVAFLISAGRSHAFPELRAFVESDVVCSYETFLRKKWEKFRIRTGKCSCMSPNIW